MDRSPLMIAAVVALAGLGSVIYFGPSWVASRRRLPQGGMIFILNMFLGWTVVGWVGALAWALLGRQRPDQQRHPAGD